MGQLRVVFSPDFVPGGCEVLSVASVQNLHSFCIDQSPDKFNPQKSNHKPDFIIFFPDGDVRIVGGTVLHHGDFDFPTHFH